MNKKPTPFKVREDGLGWEEGPVKVVGRPRPFDPKRALQWNSEMLRLSPQLGKWHPRGVFRFKTWEDFNQWKVTRKMRPHP